MVRTLALRSAVGALAGVVATTGLLVPAQAQSGAPASVSDSGALIGWGTQAHGPVPGAPVDAYTLPQELRGTAFSKVLPNTAFSLALTAAGKVVVLGTTGNPLAVIEEIPSNVGSATVVDIATNGDWAGAVTSDGKARVWGFEESYAEPTDVPEDLTDVAKLAISRDYHAAAVKKNGDVVMWGYLDEGGAEGVPTNIGPGVKAITAGAGHYYALKADGNVVAWGKNNYGQTTLPDSVSSGGHVVQIEAGYDTGLALLDDGSVEYWGYRANPADPGDYVPLPESLDGKNVVQIAAREHKFAALDDTGTVTVWTSETGVATELEETAPELAGADVVGLGFGGRFLVALVTKVLEVNKAGATGTPTVGQTLTGAPATFSGSPTAVTSQWLADGAAIPGATGTSLVLTSAQLGKRIAFATTATKAGEEPFISTSATVGPVTSPPQPPRVIVTVKPTFKVNKAPTSKKKGKATVTVAPRSPYGKATGKATVTIKKGKTTKKIKVTLSGGKKSISLPKLKKGTWKVQISYNGDKNYKAAKSKSYNLKIKK